MLALIACLLAADEGADALGKLAELGLKPASGFAVAAEENAFATAFAGFRRQETELAKALKEYGAFERKVAAAKKEVETLRAQLQGARSGFDPGLRGNELVNRINYLQDEVRQRDLLLADEASGKDVRAKLSKARTAFLEKTVELRKLADAAQAKYAELAKNSAVAAAVEAAAEETKKPLALGPSKQFERNVQALEKAEARSQTADIALRREGQTYMIEVVLNGKTATTMVFDTGASSVSLPAGLAGSLGLVPGPGTQQVRVTIADGRSFTAHRMTLESVRVGKFTARNVDCIVMPAEHSNAPALLGGAFLNRFNYQMDQGTGKLRLSQLGEDGDAPAPKGKAAKKPAKKKP